MDEGDIKLINCSMEETREGDRKLHGWMYIKSYRRLD